HDTGKAPQDALQILQIHIRDCTILLASGTESNISVPASPVSRNAFKRAKTTYSEDSSILARTRISEMCGGRSKLGDAD
ncbi:hypothetical protein WG66_006658, partial [Moniliophthora roreri]